MKDFYSFPKEDQARWIQKTASEYAADATAMLIGDMPEDVAFDISDLQYLSCVYYQDARKTLGIE